VIGLLRGLSGSNELQVVQVLQWLLYAAGFSVIAFVPFPVHEPRQSASGAAARNSLDVALELLWTPLGTLIALCLVFSKRLPALANVAASLGLLAACFLYLRPARLADKIMLIIPAGSATSASAARGVGMRLWKWLRNEMRPSNLMAWLVVVVVMSLSIDPSDTSRPVPASMQSLRAQLDPWLPLILIGVFTIAVAICGRFAGNRALALRALRALPLTAHQITRMLVLRATAPALFVTIAVLLINEWAAFVDRSFVAAAGMHIAVMLTAWPVAAISVGSTKPWLRTLLLLAALLWSIAVPVAVVIAETAALIWFTAPLTVGVFYWKLWVLIARRSEPYAPVSAEIHAVSRLTADLG
jgi:hypothetical protein